MNLRGFVVVVCLAVGTLSATAQLPENFTRKNTWTVFTEYSGTSSHILLGGARDRKWVSLGGSYARRLWRSRVGDFSYLAEVRPLLFESDPIQIDNFTETFTNPPGSFSGQSSSTVIFPCTPATFTNTFPVSGVSGAPSGTLTVVDHVSCGRRWNFAQAFTPLGLRQSFRRGQRVQPFVVVTAGYMYSSKPIPTELAGSFNFEFGFGGGIEVFRTARQSVAVEYRYHHFSNKNTAADNPGVDNGIFKLNYSFGR